jgi:hypothetical protein
MTPIYWQNFLEDSSEKQVLYAKGFASRDKRACLQVPKPDVSVFKTKNIYDTVDRNFAGISHR